MKYSTICLLLACAAAPAAAQDAEADRPVPPPIITTEVPESDKTKDVDKDGEDFDLATMMEVFDKMFPAQPDPAPERLALARTTAAGVLPDGTYAAMFDEVMGGMVDKILALTPADFGENRSKDGAAAPNTSLRETIAKGDPHFEERMRITRRVIGEELVKVSALIGRPQLSGGAPSQLSR